MRGFCFEEVKLFKNHTEPQIWTKYGFVEKATNFCFSFWFYVCEEVLIEEKNLILKMNSCQI